MTEKKPLAPWEKALVDLRNPGGRVTEGSWGWRKLDVLSIDTSQLDNLIHSLICVGEEFCMAVLRPEGLLDSSRVAYVTWGVYWGMNEHQIYDEMNRQYTEGSDGSVGGTGTAGSTDGPATDAPGSTRNWRPVEGGPDAP